MSRFIGFALVCAFIGILAGTAVVRPSEGASFAVQTGAVFNNPYGNEDQRLYLNNYINHAIDSTPSGETIRIATWAIDQRTTKNRLIAAHNRGVNVKIVTHAGNYTDEVKELEKVLGTNYKNDSFIVKCYQGCRTGSNAAMHAKFHTFSRTDGKSQVVIVGTANLTQGVRKSWNNYYTVVGNAPIYDFYFKVFGQLRLDKKPSSSYMTASSNGVVAYMLPKPAVYRPSKDPVWRELNNVQCKGATGGTGYNGKTVVRVSMYKWKGKRGLWLAKKLRALDNKGCLVQVIVNWKTTDRSIKRELKRGTNYGGINIRNAYRYKSDITYNHSKNLMISGVHRGDTSAKMIMTGSANFDNTGIFRDDETILKVTSHKAYDQYNTNWLNVWKNYSYKIR